MLLLFDRAIKIYTFCVPISATIFKNDLDVPTLRICVIFIYYILRRCI